MPVRGGGVVVIRPPVSGPSGPVAAPADFALDEIIIDALQTQMQRGSATSSFDRAAISRPIEALTSMDQRSTQ